MVGLLRFIGLVNAAVWFGGLVFFTMAERVIYPAPGNQARLALREEPAAPPVMYQTWSDLLFLHWEWDATEIQRTLPPGLFVDTFGGKAYLAVTPFFMNNVRASFLPEIPGTANFMELNVRTYVYDQTGRAGVWFYSLDCNQSLAALLARTFFPSPITTRICTPGNVQK